MESLILCRYGEIGLKGGNRGAFERALLRQVRRRLPEGASAEHAGGQFVVRAPEARAQQVAADLARVFGVVAVLPAVAVPGDMTAMADAALALAERARDGGARTFKIAARRVWKGFAATSPEINRVLGARVAAASGLAVDVHDPDLVLTVQVRSDAAYLWGPSLPGPGGLPTGTSGRALLLLSGGIDSPVAGYMAGKRGLAVSAVYFHAFPFTGDRTRQKVVDICGVLARYFGSLRLWVAPIADIQVAIRDGCPAPFATLLTRRMMVRVGEELCRRERAGALVTGDSLGQVASQTLEALTAVGEVAQLPTLRPLVGLDKDEIVALARRIGTYDISIRPYDDACALFAPRHPRTRPTRESVRAAEARLPVDELVAAAVARAERSLITP